MKNPVSQNEEAFSLAEAIDYIPGSVLIKTIYRKLTGNISMVSFDTGQIMSSKISPFDTFIQIIDGKAEVVINNKIHMLITGQSIIIPAHTRNTLKANVRFKMLSTVIKSGYDDITF